jgi:hypothetical protein
MVNFFERVLQYPEYYRQFNCGQSLITAFNCPMEARLMKTKYAGLWSKYNYLLYVIDGRKVWHTARGSYEIQKDSCVFVRKGGAILEQFWDTGFCVLLFFMPDELSDHSRKMAARTKTEFCLAPPEQPEQERQRSRIRKRLRKPLAFQPRLQDPLRQGPPGLPTSRR